jgi:Tfp pilus assembly protein PilN
MSYLTMGLGGALLLICAVFGIYFQISQNTIQEQAGNISKLTVAVTEQQAAIEQLKIDAAKQAEITRELDGKYQAS